MSADASVRRSEGVFVVEGATSIGDAVAAEWEIEGEYTAPGVDPVSRAPHHRLGVGVLERISGLSTPPGNLALVVRPPATTTLEGYSVVLVAHGVRDPGNLGTMIRSADAAGIDAVAVVAGSTDPYSPKVVRSTAGSLFRIPVMETDLDAVATGDRRILATSSHRGNSHRAIDYSGTIAIVVGNESQGLDDSDLGSIDADRVEWVRIEHGGRAESLNVAMASTLLCFEAVARRSSK